MNIFKNIVVNLQAKGPAAVMCLWLICVTLLGLYGHTPMAESALTVLSVWGGAIFIGLSSKIQ